MAVSSVLLSVGGSDPTAAAAPGDYTASDLTKMVQASQCPAVGDAVIALADLNVDGLRRPTSYRAGLDEFMIRLGADGLGGDATPAFGAVRNLRVSSDGRELGGDLTGMPPWLEQQMKASMGQRHGVILSAASERDFKCQIGHVHPFALTALLVDVPGVDTSIKNMDDLRRLFAASSGGSNMVRSARDIIAAAVQRGAISTERAGYYSGLALDGEDISYLDECAGSMVIAHSNQQALQQAHNALDFGFGQHDDPAAEFARLYPPGQYDPDDDEEMSEDNSYAPQRTPTVSDQQTRRASAYAPIGDAELFSRLFGRAPKPGELDG